MSAKTIAFAPRRKGGDAPICYCPTKAIEYGKKSVGKPRYHFEQLGRR